KDPEKRAAYDQLGSYQPGEEVRPPPDWQQQYARSRSFDDLDFSDLFASIRRGWSRSARDRKPSPVPGEDYETSVHITLEEAYAGKQLKLDLATPEFDELGFVRHVANAVTINIPKGAADGQRLRVPGKGGKGLHGGRDGDLYLNIILHPHPL